VKIAHVLFLSGLVPGLLACTATTPLATANDGSPQPGSGGSGGGPPALDAAGGVGASDGAAGESGHQDGPGTCSEEALADAGTRSMSPPDLCGACRCVGGIMLCADIYCPPLDAGDDLGPPSCALDEALTFGSQGGFIEFSDESQLAKDGTLQIRRDWSFRSGHDGPAECSGPIDCQRLAVVRAALADTDVRNALALPTPPSYGSSIPDTGTWIFRTAGGRGFDLMAEGARPAGLLALQSVLEALYTSVVQSSACQNLGR
jgi:hypothetical protein